MILDWEMGILAGVGSGLLGALVGLVGTLVLTAVQRRILHDTGVKEFPKNTGERSD